MDAGRLDTPTVRRITCGRCGREFECGPVGDCWCEAEPYRLPMPADNSDCLCPDCLRRAAAEQK